MIRTHRYNDRHRLWQLLPVLLVALFLSAPMAHASTQEFTVIAVGVDYNSQRAEAAALDYARKRAVYLAINKLGVKEPGKVGVLLTDDQLAQIIRGETIVRTQRKLDKTYEEIKVTIVDEALRKALKMKDVAIADAPPMRNILVLAATVVNPKKTLVWEKENPLRAPLATELLRQGHGAIMLPGGDLADLRLIDGENVDKVKPDELKPMFERYGADEIIIVLYTPGTLGTEQPDKVLLRRLNMIDPHDESLEGSPAAALDDASTRAGRTSQLIASAAVQIASSTAQTARQKLDAATKIPVHFIYAIPRDLAQMAEIIRESPGVMQLEMPAINLNNVTGTIYLNGDKTALRKVLASKGLVCRDKGTEWTISLR